MIILVDKTNLKMKFTVLQLTNRGREREAFKNQMRRDSSHNAKIINFESFASIIACSLRISFYLLYWIINTAYFRLTQKSALSTKQATPMMHRIFSRCVLCKLSISTFKRRRLSFATVFLKCKTSSCDWERFSTDPMPLICGASSLQKDKC